MAVKPYELGLPEKFEDFHDGQWEAVEWAAASTAKVLLLQAPTGIGKTLIMAALQRHLNEQVLYTCHTKQLQSQVVGDFEYAVELKGRANYPCLKDPSSFPKLSAQECTKDDRNCLTCHYTRCKKRNTEKPGACACLHECPYQLQKQETKDADLAILNVPLFLNEAKFVGDFSGWPWVVLDEGDATDMALMSFVQVSISARQIQKLGVGPPLKKTVPASWIQWMEDTALPAIAVRIGQLSPHRPEDIREKIRLDRLAKRFEFLIHEDMSNWAFVPEGDGVTFKPVFIAKFAESELWRHGQRFLVMSGTLPPKRMFARDMGLKEKEVDFLELPSPFPINDRPIFYLTPAGYYGKPIPAISMTHKTKDTAWPKSVQLMDDILEEFHPEDKALVHAVSYELARFICDKSRYPERLMIHNNNDRIERLEEFKERQDNAVMVSPSMERGVDLPGDLCRAIIIPKIPYPNLGDAQISRRLYSANDGPIWYAWQAIRVLEQSCGRGNRFLGDRCAIYITDEQFWRLYQEYKWLFAKYIKEAMVLNPSKRLVEYWHAR